jgi:hypothetical protein
MNWLAEAPHDDHPAQDRRADLLVLHRVEVTPGKFAQFALPPGTPTAEVERAGRVERAAELEVPHHHTRLGLGCIFYFPRAPCPEDGTRAFKMINLMFPWMFLAVDDGEIWSLTREQCKTYGMTKRVPEEAAR